MEEGGKIRLAPRIGEGIYKTLFLVLSENDNRPVIF
jgi:hypothetical protein